MRSRIIVIFSGIIALWLLSYNAIAQDIGVELKQGEEKVFKRAVNYFEEEDFINAKRDFSQLITLYPRESYFNLVYGACMVYTNEDLPKAIKFLNYAAQHGELEAYYYLGLAYHLQYMFDRALSNYNKFVEQADNKAIEFYPVDRQISMAKNGKELVKYAYNLNVINNKTINEDKFYYSYQLSSVYGEIVKTPEEFRSRFDKKRNYEGLMYVAKQQNRAFFSSYGNNKHNSLDIYFVEQVDGKWSTPQLINDVINTSEDEDYPFLHPNGKVLYFSSKGHNSMGGYDIFSSSYDSIKQNFSVPINLDFPINTPLDDIMYTTDIYGEEAYFASTRNTEAGKISVFNILVNKNPDIYVLDNINDIRKHAQLEVNTIITADMQKTNIDSLSISDYQSENIDSILFTSEDSTGIKDSLIEDNYENVITSIQYQIAEIELKIETYNSIIYNSELELKTLITEINELNELRTQIINSGLSTAEIESELSKIDVEINEKTLLLDETLRINNYYRKLANSHQTNLNYHKNNFNNTLKSEQSDKNTEALEKLQKDLTNLQADNSKEDYLAQKQKAKTEDLNKSDTYESRLNEIENEINDIDSNIESLGIETLTLKDKENQQQNILEIKRLKNKRAEKINEYKTILTQYEFSKRNLSETEFILNNTDKLISGFYNPIYDNTDTLSIDDNTYIEANKLVNTQKQKNLKDLATIQTNILTSNEYFVKTQIDFESLIAENNNIREQQNANKKLLNEYEALNTENINAEYEEIIEGKISVAKDLIEESEKLAQSLDTIKDNDKRKEIKDQISENQNNLVAINNDINRTLASADKIEDDFNELADNNINSDTVLNIANSSDSLRSRDEIIAIKTEEINTGIEKIDSVYKSEVVEDKQKLEQLYSNLENEIIRFESETDPNKQKEIADNLSTEYQEARKAHSELSMQKLKVNSEKYDYYNNKYESVFAETPNDDRLSLSLNYQEEAREFDNKSKDLLQLAENTDNEATKQDYIIEASKYKELAVNSYKNAYNVLASTDITEFEEHYTTNDLENRTDEIVQNYNDKIIPIIETDITNKYLALEEKCDNYINNANYYLNIADSLNAEIEKLSLEYKEAINTERETIGETVQSLNKYRQVVLDSAVNNITMYHQTMFEINKAIITDKESSLSDSEKQKSQQIDEEYAEYHKNSNNLKTSNSDYKYVLLGEVLVLGENLLKEQERIIGKLNIVNLKIQEFNKRVNDASSEMIATDAWLAENSITVSEYNLYREQNTEETIKKIVFNSENRNTQNKFEKLDADIEEISNEIQDKKIEIYELESNLALANDTEKEAIENKINKTKEELTKKENQLEEKRQETVLLAYESGKELVENKEPVYKSVEETSRTLSQHADTLFNSAQKIREEAVEYREQISQREYDERINKANELESEAIKTLTIANFVAEKDDPQIAEKVLKEHELHISNIKQIDFELIADNNTNDIAQEDVVTEDVVTEDVVTEDVVTEDVVTEDVVTEDVVTEDVVTEDVVTEDVVTEDVVTEDVVTEDVVTEDVVTEDVVTEDVVTDMKSDNNEEELITESQQDTITNIEHIENDTYIRTLEQEDEEFFTELIIQDKNSAKQYSTYSDDIAKVNKKLAKTDEKINSVKSKNLSPQRQENKLARLERKQEKQENKLYAIELDKSLFVYENKLHIIDSIEVENPEVYYYTENLLHESKALHIESEEIKEYIANNNDLTISEKNELNKKAIEYYDKANEIQNEAITLRIADDLSLIEDQFIADNNQTNDEQTAVDSLPIEETVVKSDSLLTNNENTDYDELGTQQNASTLPSFRILEINNYVTEQNNNNDVLDNTGLLFRIQFAAYNQIMPDGKFNMSPLFYEQIPNRNIVRYMVGTFYTYEGANYALPKVKTQGFNDAFVVAYYNGERISIYEANRLLAQKDDLAYNQQSNDEINMVENNQSSNKTPYYVILESDDTNVNKTDNIDTITEVTDESKPKNVNTTNNVFLTVQIGAGRNIIDPNLLFGINTDYIEYADNGYVRHLNGTYFDLNTVIANRNRIKQIGIDDAFVSAYAYGKKVTVNEALQLLRQMSPEELADNSAKLYNQDSDEIEKPIITEPDTEQDTLYESLDSDLGIELVETTQEIITEFYVQIGAYRREVDQNLYSRFQNIAQETEIKLVKYDNGLIIYRIGPITTYQDALIYQTRAKADGIQDAFIVVIRNGERIPLNQVL